MELLTLRGSQLLPASNKGISSGGGGGGVMALHRAVLVDVRSCACI